MAKKNYFDQFGHTGEPGQLAAQNGGPRVEVLDKIRGTLEFMDVSLEDATTAVNLYFKEIAREAEIAPINGVKIEDNTISPPEIATNHNGPMPSLGYLDRYICSAAFWKIEK